MQVAGDEVSGAPKRAALLAAAVLATAIGVVIAVLLPLENPNSDHRPTDLSLAVNNGRVRAVQRLLSRGADPNEDGGLGYPPVVDAIETGNTAITKLLIDAGARLDGPGLEDIYIVPLTESDWGMLRLLIDRGVSICSTLDELGGRPSSHIPDASTDEERETRSSIVVAAGQC